MADLELLNVVKTYSGTTTPATDKVSLRIEDGEFMVLLGPSGCGKTTLLRTVAGLELPDSGQVVIGGRDVTYLEPRRRNLSMVFQSYAVFPHKTVAENIGFGLRMRGMPGGEIRRKVAWAADLLRLSDFLDRRPAKLSGGQRQRVAVARAIVVDSDLLLMDEPLSNLDALLRLSFRAELKKLVSELGTTTLFVTHDQVEALSLGDRVAIMRDGHVVQCGGPTEVYDLPASEFVGGFLGSPPMNFLEGTIAGAADGDLRLDLDGTSLPAPPELADYRDRRVRLGIRPETITVATDPGAGLNATLQVFEPLGASVLLTLDLCGQPVKVVAPPTFRAKVGDTLDLTVPMRQCRWYDPQTQLLLEVAAS